MSVKGDKSRVRNVNKYRQNYDTIFNKKQGKNRGEVMKSRQRCEICGMFAIVGFSDCGLICEDCFNREQAANTFNLAIQKASDVVKAYFADHYTGEEHDKNECAAICRLIEAQKMVTHLKEV